MDFTFLKNNTVAFFRSDAEQAEWTQDEMSLFCTFPYVSGKKIERGMTVLFQDPATDSWQAYEIRNCTLFPGESYQQFTAEDIAISELSDCHIADDIELTNATVKTALNKILGGTGWSIGTNASTETSSADIGRGSVWEGVTTIRANWNINILPRVTVDASKGITGRYLDIITTEGTWRGLRFAIDKNMTDPCVTYDDSELYTALYGYGASYTKGSDVQTQTTAETDFSDVVWTKTSDHPAKPKGQKYLEWPAKTTSYGRNGKARFGYYQNTNIKDATKLLEKTWETLKACSDPKVSFTGTVTDLKRLGYVDKPIRLYDLAIIDLGDTQLYKQVIKLTVNFLDPTANTLTIGDYIPNIVYINRETNNNATGGSSGVSSGRGGGGGTRSKKQKGEFETTIAQNERTIKLEALQVDENREKLRAAGITIDPETGVAIYAEDVPNGIGANFNVMANAITTEVYDRKEGEAELTTKITQTANAIELEASARATADGTLDGKITVEAGKITQIVTAVGKDGKVTAASICLAINNGESSATINADKIYLLGETIAQTISADYINTKIATIPTLNGIAASFSGNVSCAGLLALQVYVGSGTSYTNISDGVSALNLSLSGNTYTLQYKKFSDSAWQDVGTFSRATTLSGAWSSGVFTVTASPQGNTKKTSLTTGGHWGVAADDEDPKHYYGQISATIDNKATLHDTGKTFEVDASGIYNNGVDYANSLYNKWNNGTATSLYYYDTTTLSYKVATGGAKRWYYKS